MKRFKPAPFCASWHRHPHPDREAKENGKQGNGVAFIFWLHLKDAKIIGGKMKRLFSQLFQVQRVKLIFSVRFLSVATKPSVRVFNLGENPVDPTKGVISETLGHTQQLGVRRGSCEQIWRWKSPLALGCRDVPETPTFRGCLWVMSNGRNRESGEDGAEE